jgi:hypothetical protein
VADLEPTISMMRAVKEDENIRFTYSRSSSVSVGILLRDGEPEFNSQQAVMGIFLFAIAYRPDLGPSNGYRVLFSRG